MMSPYPTTASQINIGQRLGHLAIALLLAVVLSQAAAHAQGFNSGSTGVDGALDFSSVPPGTTIIFDPTTFNPPLDQDHDNVYHFTTITIPANVTVRLAANVLGTVPVVWLASGMVQITGTLDLQGATGHAWNAPPFPAAAGAGGYEGGTGGTSTTAARAGNGPGGGKVAGGHGGGAGHAVAGERDTNVDTGGAAYGNDFLLPLLGGSGGAGGEFFNPAPAIGGNGSGGGAGGGALLIASSVSITVNGTITAKGGNGGNPATSGLLGGGGSGGAMRLMAPIINGTGTLNAAGGSAARDGSRGRIRLEAFQHTFTGSINPTPIVVSPGLIFPPSSGPSVRVGRVASVLVPANPTGSFVTPDVTLDNVAAVTLEIEAHNIPLGTVVELTIFSETGPPQTVTSTPLAGTLADSTATATVTLPHGFSRFFVEANWIP